MDAQTIPLDVDKTKKILQQLLLDVDTLIKNAEASMPNGLSIMVHSYPDDNMKTVKNERIGFSLLDISGIQ